MEVRDTVALLMASCRTSPSVCVHNPTRLSVWISDPDHLDGASGVGSTGLQCSWFWCASAGLIMCMYTCTLGASKSRIVAE